MQAVKKAYQQYLKDLSIRSEFSDYVELIEIHYVYTTNTSTSSSTATTTAITNRVNGIDVKLLGTVEEDFGLDQNKQFPFRLSKIAYKQCLRNSFKY